MRRPYSKKLFRHMCSARSLLEPSPFRNQVIPSHSFIDHSSVAVLTRSAIENYLVMTWQPLAYRLATAGQRGCWRLLLRMPTLQKPYADGAKRS